MPSYSFPGVYVSVDSATAAPAAEQGATIERHGCRITLRRFDGPLARELFLHCLPSVAQDPGAQAESVYRAIADVLAAEGADYRAVVAETVFLRDSGADIDTVRASRSRALAAVGGAPQSPAITEIGQPPLAEHAHVAVSVQALVASGAPHCVASVETQPDCGCAECARAHGVVIGIGDETRFQAAGLCGPGDDAYHQALGMFALAEQLLRKARMDFRDVVRTWIYLRDIDRDYDALNRARREFFEARNIDPVPASTGIGGGPVSMAHDLSLGLFALKAPHSPAKTVMTSPTLNEAGEYGADFVRGLKVRESNRLALHVSGTASIDENGNTAHPGDFDAQAARMLVNIAALLDGQGAGFGDVVSATSYLKHPSDIERLRGAFRNAGFEGFPHAIVAAPICRADLLCETEVLALLPHAGHTMS